MSPFRGVYTIKCTAGWITPSSGAWLQWGTCVEAGVMLFEQLAQFSSACSNVHRSEAVVPHGGRKTQASPALRRIDSTLYSVILKVKQWSWPGDMRSVRNQCEQNRKRLLLLCRLRFLNEQDKMYWLMSLSNAGSQILLALDLQRPASCFLLFSVFVLR